MQFVLTIDCDNAAFELSLQDEVASILRRVAAKLNASSVDAGTLADTNGNTVGSFAFLPSSGELS